MIRLIQGRNRDGARGMLEAMHADRKRVFVDRLKWDLPVEDGRYERDGFDDDHALYLVATTPGADMHLGSVRLLPTTRPHLLGDVFPQLVTGEVPRGPDVFEITRLCTSPALADWEAHRAVRQRLATALIEYALTVGISRYTMISHTAFLSLLLAIGWDVEPLGLPQAINGETLGALQVNVHASTLQLFRRTFDIGEPVLRLDLSE
jgi:N-acyl-L-homoserine lactone synthetase